LPAHEGTEAISARPTKAAIRLILVDLLVITCAVRKRHA
jgi:hypothetical protein